MNANITILTVTGQHPSEAIGGAELQCHLISSGLCKYAKKVIFCTVFSEKNSECVASTGLIHIAIGSPDSLSRRILRFKKILKKHLPDIVYVRCLYSLWWITILCHWLKIPVAYHTSNDKCCGYLGFKTNANSLKSFKKFIVNNFYIFFIRFSNVTFCQTKYQRKLLQDNFKKSSFLVRNGHPVCDKTQKKYSIPKNIIWVAKQAKNPGLFLRLVKELKEYKNYKFWMVGLFDNESELEYKKLEQKYESFHFLGKLTNEEVNKILEESHVLVNTSYHEGFANTFIQAWLRGVPVVSLFVNPDKILTKERIGFCSGSVKQAAIDINSLFTGEGELFKEYSQNARDYALSEHDIRKTSFHIFNALKKLTTV